MIKDKINFFEVYFHGLRPPCDERGFQIGNELKILESILQQGAILSRAKQKERGIKSIFNDNVNRNGLNNISICKFIGDECRMSDAFLNWVRNHIAIILPREMDDCEFDCNTECLGLDGEVYVKDEIPVKHFLGILISKGNDSFKNFFREISRLCTNEKDLYRRINKYLTSTIKPIQKIIKENGYNLKLFDHSGEEILSAEEYVSLFTIKQNNKETTL